LLRQQVTAEVRDVAGLGGRDVVDSDEHIHVRVLVTLSACARSKQCQLADTHAGSTANPAYEALERGALACTEPDHARLVA
jgi:hypothetical protein